MPKNEHMGRERKGRALKIDRKRSLSEDRLREGQSVVFRNSSGRAAKVDGSGSSLAEAAAKKLGGRDAVGFQVVSDADMAKAVRRGFSLKAIHALKKSGVTDKEIGDLIIKPRTLTHRKEKRQKLTIQESDRAARLARVMALAEKTFANKDKADRWLHKSLGALDGQQPIALLGTSAGTRIIEDILARIGWGAAA